MQSNVAFGSFMGLTDLIKKGLITPEHFAQQCIEVAEKYEAAKSAPIVSNIQEWR